MAKDCSMMEVTSFGANEEDEGIELSLGLSIGGNNLGKSTKLNLQEKKSPNVDSDLSKENQNFNFTRNSWMQTIVDDSEHESGSEHIDPQRKREIQARRKREEKLRKGGFSESRVRVREMGENEAEVAGRACKREKNEEREDLNHNAVQNLSQQPVVVVPYPPLQSVPLGNVVAYPCVVPCLAPRNEENGKSSFRPYQGNDKNGVANGSPVCSNSFVSENRSTSQQGCSNSDTGSDSSDRKPEKSKLKHASEHSVSSNQMESTQPKNGITANTTTNKPVSPSVIQSSPTKLIEQHNSKTQPDPATKPTSSQNPNPDPPSLSKMPCVSTTGNGPDGKTITGFLYRYTNTEVSIVCVCHGSSFSPAEFVEHAGGKDVTHPLRHITVIPSAFG